MRNPPTVAQQHNAFFKECLAALGAVEAVNPAQNLYETAAGMPAAVLAAYTSGKQLSASLDALRQMALEAAADNPLALAPFRKGVSEATELAFRLERSVLGIAEQGLVSKLRRFAPFVSKEFLDKWQGNLNNETGILTESAVDLVFTALSDENGRGLFRGISDRFKIGRDQGIDRVLITNSGKYIDLEIKGSKTARWPGFSPDQQKGADSFVTNRLRTIARTANHPYRTEAIERLESLRFGAPVTGYAIVGRNLYSGGSAVEFEMRLWDQYVSKSNATRSYGFGTRF